MNDGGATDRRDEQEYNAMGRYAMDREQMTDAVDLFAVDTDFDQPEGGWGDHAELLYSLNETATAWRSRLSLDGLDADY